MSELQRISISIEADLLAEFDAFVAATSQQNRSEALRDLMRDALAKRSEPDSKVVATLAVVFDHAQRDVTERLTAEAHHHHEEVLATLHLHLTHDRCLEVSALRGNREELEHYADHVRGLRGIEHGSLTIVGPAE